jgi:putative ABC transport system permease protein
MTHDLRYGIRALLREPGFTFVAVTTLALGIGINSAVFSVVDAVLLRPLPYDEPNRLVVVWDRVSRVGQDRNIVSPANYRDWARESQSFESMAAYTEAFLNLSADGGEVERIAGVIATPNFFETLRVAPAYGRGFRAEDAGGRGDAVAWSAVISHDLWQRRFGGDPAILGKVLALNSGRGEIVGILPRGFLFSGKRVDAFVPLTLPSGEEMERGRGWRYLTVVARLRPGVTFEQAQVDMTSVAAGLAARHPEVNAGRGANVRSLEQEMLGEVRPALLLLQGSVAFVLLIAAANVAILQLSRAVRRRPELATRAALGATRRQLVKQLFAEGLLLALAGAVFGSVLAAWGARLLVVFSPTGLLRAEQATLDLRVLALTLATALASSLVSGLLPALYAAGTDVRSALQRSGRAGSGARSVGQRALVVAQVAVSLILLVGASLTARSFAALQSVDPGFRREGALVMDLSLPRAYDTAEARARFFQQLVAGVESLPGVRSAGITDNLPLSGEDASRRFNVLGSADAVLAAGRPAAEHRGVSPRYFDAMGVSVLRGRTFTESDGPEGAGVVVVNQAFAARFLGGRDALGQRIAIEDGEPRVREVVGVVADVKHFSIRAHSLPEMYVPYRDRPRPNVSLVVRATGVANGPLAAGIRGELAKVDADIPLANVKTIDAHLASASARERFSARVLGVFAALALLMAALGLYGVVAYMAAQRRSEIGLRMALGADKPAIARLVIGEGLRLTLAGLVIGLVGALALARVIAAQLYGVGPGDPAAFAWGAAALAAAALLACGVPALRATRVDPAVCLRA